MSCGTLCSCQFNWPMDTHGSKRDNISSEKAWLDFAVRYLSREAAGKGNGQESVWNVESKPYWWNTEVQLQWKNPTSNPKDSKDILLRKYEALETHLRAENKFPVDLEEEAKLWNEGKYKELFLLCNLTCLLKKVSGVHAAVVEACSKADKMKAHITQPVLQNIQNCLHSTLKATENFKRIEDPPTKRELKRKVSQNEGKENFKLCPVKRVKQTPEIDRRPVPILPKPEQMTGTDVSSAQLVSNGIASPSNSNAQDILNLASRLMEKRKNCSGPPHSSSKVALRRKLMKAFKSSNNSSPAFNPSNLTSLPACPATGSDTNVLALYSVASSNPALAPPLPREQTKNHDNSVSNLLNGSIPLNLNPLSSSASPLGDQVMASDCEIDFLSSPLPTKVQTATGNFCFDIIDNLIPSPSLSEYTQTQNASVDTPPDSFSQSPMLLNDNLLIDSNNTLFLPNDIDHLNSTSSENTNTELTTTHPSEHDGISHHVELNTKSPASTISETTSCQPLSDGGYVSADDLPTLDDLVDLGPCGEDTLLNQAGSCWSLDRFLHIEQPNSNTFSNSNASLLDQWDMLL